MIDESNKQMFKKGFNSAISLPNRNFREPEFSYACLGFADHKDLVKLQIPEFYKSGLVSQMPFIAPAIECWAKATEWPIIARHQDGIQLGIPEGITNEIRCHSSLSRVDLFLASVNEVCRATLGSNYHNTDYGLYLNVPAWIPLAIHQECHDSLVRQLRMVVHHETAHFRFAQNCLRTEQIAHARGVAAILDEVCPTERATLVEYLQNHRPEAWQNALIRSLLMGTPGGPRLIRMWWERRKRYTELRLTKSKTPEISNCNHCQ
jgi:hypothetical protein